MFGQFQAHQLIRNDLRQQLDLSALMVVRMIAKVADAYRLNRKVRTKKRRALCHRREPSNQRTDEGQLRVSLFLVSSKKYSVSD